MAKEGQLKEIAIRLKEALAESLSASTGGNYVFGGLMQDEVPIDLSNSQDLKDGTYYRGSDENMNMHFQQMKEETEIGLNANHSGFQKAFEVIQKIIDSPVSQTVIGAVQTPLDSAIKELSDALGLLGMQQAKINDDVEMNKEVIQIMDDFLMDTVKTDPAEASLMISLLKQRLDASMHLLVNKESMINFIRGR